MSSVEQLSAKLEANGQGHLLRFLDQFNNNDQFEYLQHLSTVDFEETNELFRKAMHSLEEDVEKLDSRMKPIPPSQFESEERSTIDQLDKYRRSGLEEISKGHVGVLLLAGGQGTRLGVSYPKGMYSIGLPSGKTLFQVQAERIIRVQELAQSQTKRHGRITWYIMTSGPTRESTEEFLKSNNFFGLCPEDIVLFEQGLLPCYDMEGKIIMEEKNRVALAPDGNGGIYRALHQNGVLLDMERRGVKYIHVHSVDNILVKVADPVFVGYCVDKKADCGAKVVRKSSPNEAVGVVCQVDGRFQVVEYSEITETTANLLDAEGKLVFSAGNICNHFFTTSFLRQVAEQHEGKLKLHVAQKKIPYVNESGAKVKPLKPNGIKIEKFVFDVFQFSDKFVTWEVPRESEFSALKNADDAGKECPSTARKDLFRLHKRYVEAAGGTVLGEIVEISPLLSYSGENLTPVVSGKTLQSPVHLTAEEIISNGCNHY